MVVVVATLAFVVFLVIFLVLALVLVLVLVTRQIIEQQAFNPIINGINVLGIERVKRDTDMKGLWEQGFPCIITHKYQLTTCSDDAKREKRENERG